MKKKKKKKKKKEAEGGGGVGGGRGGGEEEVWGVYISSQIYTLTVTYCHNSEVVISKYGLG